MDISQWINLIGLIYNADTILLDPPTWTLVVEMRIALILPIMFFVYKCLQFKLQIVLTTLLFMVMSFYDSQFSYMCHFALGIMIANKKGFIFDNLLRISKGKIILLIIFGLFFYTCRWPWKEMVVGYFGDCYSIDMFFSFLNGIGSALIIVAFFHPFIEKIMSNKLGGFLGEISYSLYLIHFPILLLCVSIFSNWIINFGMLFLVALSLAWSMYRFVEKPMILIGRIVSEKMAR